MASQIETFKYKSRARAHTHTKQAICTVQLYTKKKCFLRHPIIIIILCIWYY